VISRIARITAVALVGAALGPWPVRAATPELDAIERDAAQVEARLQLLERAGLPGDEPPAARAQRRAADGVRQGELGDWLHAAVLLTDAVDEPAWRAAADRPRALLALADALRRRGLCGAARLRYAEWLALGLPERRGEAVSGALECAVAERRQADVERLLAEARRAFEGEPPADVRYLVAKSAWQRSDLAPAERIAGAAAAFEKVGPPFQLQAWYFQGVLRIEAGDLDGALTWFGRCAEAPRPVTAAAPARAGARDAEVRELCQLALGRIHGQRGQVAAAVNWYAAIPWDSPRFLDAMQELSQVYVQGKEYERALRLSSIISELAPESPHAPEATLLQGHLHQRLGHFAQASEAYNVVINTYAPVRDEIDAVLATQEDPVRYFDELVARPGRGGDLSGVLPPMAVRWATTSRDVAVALGLVRAMDDARREVKETLELADRLEAVLQRGGGLDAFPALQLAYAQAQAVETAAALDEGKSVAVLSAVAAPLLAPEPRAELLRARAARLELEARVEALPATHAAVEDRLARMRARIDRVDQSAYQLGFHLEGSQSAIAGTEAWIDQHRADLAADAEARQELQDELHKQRGVVEGYGAELSALRQEIARVRDAAGGVEAMAEEARLRAAYLAAAQRERQAAEPARELCTAPQRAAFERVDLMRDHLGVLRGRAQAREEQIAARAVRESAATRVLITAEREQLAGEGAALDGVRSDARGMLGAIAVRSVAEVRAQFYQLVLQADVGIVDVAWSRKRQRLERIQGLAVQKDAEVEALDREFRALLRETE
jgi:tetratricopeptide (TPR) repeat protein